MLYTLMLTRTDREVKKANRDLQSLLQSMDGPISKMETVQRKYSELLAEMKRTEREHIKAKKRGDQLQKDKDAQRSELTKANSMKEKLEKLSRELTKENKKLKVRFAAACNLSDAVIDGACRRTSVR
jgi:predicted RNase H-like nuclease (RuvC/YqgF family)